MYSDANDGGGSSVAGPFAYYPASTVELAARADELLTAAERIADVGDRAYVHERRAIAATQGELAALFDARLAELRARNLDLKGAAVVASAAMTIWGQAVVDYNAGISELNAEYALGHQPATGPAAEVMGSLHDRLAHLDAALDDDARRVASILDRGPSEAAIQRLFQHGTLPLRVTSLLDEYDFSDVDIGELVRRLQRHGDLPYDLDPHQIADAVRLLEQLTDPDNVWMSWSRTVLESVWDQLAELDPRAVDLVVLGLSDDQLGLLDRLVSGSGPDDHPLLPSGLEVGLDRFDLADLHTLFLANASADTLLRLRRAWPSIEPSVRGVDNVEDGTMERPRWGDPEPRDFFAPGGSSAEDIDQGAVGDCWMLAKLAALAEDDPEWVSDHVRRNPNGTITVTFYDDSGDRHEVTVTDQLPLDEDGDLVFSGNQDSSARWADYYEKAFALISDNHHDGERGYGGIEFGSPTDGAQLMTGHESDHLDGFDAIRDHAQAGEPVVVSTTDDAPASGAFVPNHMFHVQGLAGDEIILGNPWSSDEDPLVLTEDEFDDLIDGAAVVHHD